MSFDILVRNEGTLFLFHLASDEARAWWDEHVQDGPDWRGPNWPVVEHRYAADIIEGAVAAGLTVGEL